MPHADYPEVPPPPSIPESLTVSPGKPFRIPLPMSFSFKSVTRLDDEVEAFGRFVCRAYRGPNNEKVECDFVRDPVEGSLMEQWIRVVFRADGEMHPVVFRADGPAPILASLDGRI